MNIKEILVKYQISEDQSQPILKGLKIEKKASDVLTPKQITAVERVCELLQKKVPLDEALVQSLDSIRQNSGAIVQSVKGSAAVVDAPISAKTVLSLQDYANQTIPPDAKKQFVNGALDGVDHVAKQFSPGNGYHFGKAIANDLVSALPNAEEEIQKEIQARLGERKAQTSA